MNAGLPLVTKSACKWLPSMHGEKKRMLTCQSFGLSLDSLLSASPSLHATRQTSILESTYRRSLGIGSADDNRFVFAQFINQTGCKSNTMHCTSRK